MLVSETVLVLCTHRIPSPLVTLSGRHSFFASAQCHQSRKGQLSSPQFEKGTRFHLSQYASQVRKDCEFCGGYMTRRLPQLLFATVCTATLEAMAGNTLPSGSSLTNGQYIVSSTGNYWMSMQSDGSLVMYRSDSTIRYAMKKHGRYAIMQEDGNFVEYNSYMYPIWYTSTHGNPGAYLAIQDDGNLVVYSRTGIPLWNIGAETTEGNPRLPGDVIGRDLNTIGLGAFGHLGLWDGSRVIQADKVFGNAIAISTLNAYKSASKFWGTASAKIPEGETWPRCYLYYCSDSGLAYESLSGRQVVAKAAYQAYLIGADYTISANVKFADYAGDRRPAIRGMYRCDTFVWAALWRSTHYLHPTTPEQGRWSDFVHRLHWVDINTPRNMFYSLKNYQ